MKTRWCCHLFGMTDVVPSGAAKAAVSTFSIFEGLNGFDGRVKDWCEDELPDTLSNMNCDGVGV